MQKVGAAFELIIENKKAETMQCFMYLGRKITTYDGKNEMYIKSSQNSTDKTGILQ